MSAPALDPVAAELAAAWETFREAVNPPAHLAIRRHFDDIVGALLRRTIAAEAKATPAAAPFVHGDPRVDRWQLTAGGTCAPSPSTIGPPAGFEPLAAWSPLHADLDCVMWERPLRACEVPPATTEESALARILVAWDEWPDIKGRYFNLLADISADLERAGLGCAGALTEAARAIVARAAERGQP